MVIEKHDDEDLRAQAALLLSQATAQSLEIGQALAAARAASPLHEGLSAAGERISDAIRRLSSALQSSRFPLRQSDLMALQSVVSAPEIRGLIAEATSARSSEAVRVQAVATAAAATRAEVQTDIRDIFERRIFDPYLHFGSKADEDEYRRREAEAKKYIEAQLAKHTPEGDLNASGGTLGQMLDANAHGAGASPDFMPRWNALAEKVQRQRAAMHAAGQKTEEFDGNLSAAARRFLKAKGLSDSQIDAALAGGKDPLQVVKPYLGNDHASRDLEKEANPVVATGTPQVTTAAAPEKVGSATIDTIGAGLKAAGVQVSSDAPADKEGHGLPGHVGEKGRASSPSLPA